MGEYLSRKYSYLPHTEKWQELHPEQWRAIRQGVTSESNVVETDLPPWIQEFIKNTMDDPIAVSRLARYERMKLLGQI